MSGIRAQKKRQTRQAIVSAAMKLFAARGFEQTSMDELAREAGMRLSKDHEMPANNRMLVWSKDG